MNLKSIHRDYMMKPKRDNNCINCCNCRNFRNCPLGPHALHCYLRNWIDENLVKCSSVVTISTAALDIFTRLVTDKMLV